MNAWSRFVSACRPVAKAVVAFAAPGALIVGQAMVRGEPVTDTLWLTALGTAVVTSLSVYATPNTDPRATHQDESVQPPEDEPGEHRPERVNVIREG